MVFHVIFTDLVKSRSESLGGVSDLLETSTFTPFPLEEPASPKLWPSVSNHFQQSRKRRASTIIESDEDVKKRVQPDVECPSCERRGVSCWLNICARGYHEMRGARGIDLRTSNFLVGGFAEEPAPRELPMAPAATASGRGQQQIVERIDSAAAAGGHDTSQL